MGKILTEISEGELLDKITNRNKIKRDKKHSAYKRSAKRI